ncbi:MAG TPA: hypothetical protein VLL25_18330 [Acidimicrobiales bacterium]|nr:hypothetical protein [Acidimicrobiales bacterium]
MAEALLRRRLDELGVAARVGSAGFLDDGLPAMDDAIATMAEDGYDLTTHRSRTVTTDMVDRADLVLTMTRQHTIELTLMAPDAWPRVFQLREIVHRAESTGRRAPEQTFSAWLTDVGSGRTRAGLIGGRQEDDISDPVGQPRQEYDRTKRLLDELLSKLAALFG